MKRAMKKMQKKLKEKGFTLVELLVGIVILGLLTTIGTITYNQVHQSALEKQLDNKISYVEISATKWAEEKNLDTATVINVSTLINEGYLQADDYINDNPVYENPVDNSSLLCYTIAIDKDGNTYNAKMDMEAGENCEIEFQRQMNQNIKIDAYAYENGHVITKLNKKENIVDWTNKDVLLVVSSEIYQFNKISFTAKGGSTATKNVNNNLLTTVNNNQAVDASAYANTIVVTANVYFHEEYTVGLFTNDGVKNGTIDIRIDKQSPTINNITPDTAWAREKKVEIKASDGNGSGLYGIYVSTNNTCPTTQSSYSETNDKLNKTFTEEKTFYACAIDKAGNNTTPYEIQMVNIDREGALDSDIILTKSTSDWTQSLTVNAKATDRKSGLVEYAFTENNSSPSTWQKISTAPTNQQISYDFTITANKTYYFWVKDAVGNVSNKSITIDNIDREIDSVTLTKNTSEWATSVTLTGSATDNQSRIIEYQFNQSSSVPSSGWTRVYNLQSINMTYTANKNGTYYFWVKDAAGNVDKASINISNVGSFKTVNVYSGNIEDSYYSNYQYISKIKKLINVETSNGYVISSSLNGNYVYFTVDYGNGIPKTRQTTTTYRPTYSRQATPSGDPCPEGGYESNGWCLNNDINGLVGKIKTTVCYCMNGQLSFRDPNYYDQRTLKPYLNVYGTTYVCDNVDDPPIQDTTCPAHYSKDWTSNYFFNFSYDNIHCNGTSVKLTGNSQGTFNCLWKEYPAKIVTYNCGYNEFNIGSYCYYCSYGDSYSDYSGYCSGIRTEDYKIYNYTITITYLEG